MPTHILPLEFREQVQSIMQAIADRSKLTERLMDVDLYHLQIALLWIQIAISPRDLGIEETQLEAAHLYINRELKRTSSKYQNLHQIFVFLTSDAGQEAIVRLKIKSYHRNLIDYFGIMITNPKEHKRRMLKAREESLR